MLAAVRALPTLQLGNLPIVLRRCRPCSRQSKANDSPPDGWTLTQSPETSLSKSIVFLGGRLQCGDAAISQAFRHDGLPINRQQNVNI